jgi:hypothetical protein
MPKEVKVKKQKLLVCIPLWPGDRDMGMELLKLWADLEDKFNPLVGIAIVVRFDMSISDIDPEVLSRISDKFEVFTHKVESRKATGWPAGCNQLEVGAYEWFVMKHRTNPDWEYDYMLLAEADTVPLRKGWTEEIRKEAYDSGAPILGAMLRIPDNYCEHINGNCVMHKDLWKQCREIFLSPSRIGWDAYIGHTAIAIGAASRLIWQDYRLGAPDNPWKGDDFIFEPKFYKSDKNPFYGKPVYPAMIHGIKTMDGINAVRNRLLQKSS